MAMMKKKSNKDSVATAGGLLLFLGMLVVVLVATSGIASGTDEEGIAATHSAIERAAVLCYATEGFYPPSLSYIEESYNVQVDRSRYLVNYEVFSSKEKPMIRVLKL